MSAQANFVRVRVTRPASSGADEGEGGQQELLCVVRGLLKKIKQSVLVGDYVQVIGVDWVDGRGMVEEVLPRKSELLDPAIANVDQVLLVFSADLPPFDPEQATRFLVVAEAADLPVTLVLNKADLLTDEASEAICTMVQSWGYQVLRVSAASREGIASLADSLKGRVSVFAGPSGVGKSSLINALRLGTHAAVSETMSGRRGDRDTGSSANATCDGASHAQGSSEDGEASSFALVSVSGHAMPQLEASVPNADSSRRNATTTAVEPMLSINGSRAMPHAHVGTADATFGNGCSAHSRQQTGNQATVSGRTASGLAEFQAVGDVSQIGRGKHTTRNVTLLDINGGFLADTPGFNQPALQDVSLAGLIHCFPEVAERLQERRCAFSNCQHVFDPGCALREGWDRHLFYVDLHAELKLLEDEARQRAASKKKREGTVRYKTQAGGVRSREALLEPKTHRRVNRRQVKQNMQDLINEAEHEEA